MTTETTKLLIIEAIERLARGDEYGIAERILRDLDGLSPELVQGARDKAAELRAFAAGLAFAQENNAPIFRARALAAAAERGEDVWARYDDAGALEAWGHN